MRALKSVCFVKTSGGVWCTLAPATSLLGMLQQTRKRKKFFYPQVTARNIALHSLMPYIGSSLKKVTSLFQIRLFPYKRVKFTKFSPKKVCQVRKKEFPCFMLITVMFPAKSRPYNVTNGKNCFYTCSFTKLAIFR